jgi:hypothetical protein
MVPEMVCSVSLAMLVLSGASRGSLLDRIVKCVKVAVRYPLRVVPREARVACFIELVILVFRVKSERYVRNIKGDPLEAPL